MQTNCPTTWFVIHSYLLPTPRYLVSAKTPTNVVWTTDRTKAAQFADFDTARALSWEIGGGASRVEEIAADTADRAADLHDREIADREATRRAVYDAGQRQETAEWDAQAAKETADRLAALLEAQSVKHSAELLEQAHLRSADLAAKATELRERIVSDTRLLGRPYPHTTITNVRMTAMHLLGQVSAYAVLTSDDDTINDAFALRGDVVKARDAALETFRTKKSR